MSGKRGRPARQYRLRVRTVRREPIDYEALARAALEQAAMNQAYETEHPATNDDQIQKPNTNNPHHSKEPRHDRLA